MRDPGDYLALLVTLAGDDEDIAFGQQAGGMGDGFAAVGDLDRSRRGGENGGADGGRVFGARIVISDNGDIREASGDLAHLRPLAAIAVAAAAEHHHQLAAGMGPQGLQHGLESAGLVGVIDVDGRTVRMDGDALETNVELRSGDVVVVPE